MTACLVDHVCLCHPANFNFIAGSLDARLVWDGTVQVKQDDNGHLYLNNGLAMLPPLPTDRGDLNITVELSDCVSDTC